MKIDLHFHFDSFQELNEFQVTLNPPVDVPIMTATELFKRRHEVTVVRDDLTVEKLRKAKQRLADNEVIQDKLVAVVPAKQKSKPAADRDVAPVPLSLDDIRAKVSLVIEKKGLPVATKIIKAFKVSRIAELETADYARVLKACDKELKK